MKKKIFDKDISKKGAERKGEVLFPVQKFTFRRFYISLYKNEGPISRMAGATRSSIFQIEVSRTEFILNYRTCFPWPRWVEAAVAGRGYTRPEGKRLERAAETPKNWANNEERVAASWWKATRVFHVKRVPLYFVRTCPWRGHAVHKRARVSFRQSLFSCSAVPAGYSGIGPPLKTKKAQGRRGRRWARGGVASATWKGGTWRNETLPNAVFSLREHRAFRAPQR